MKYKVGDVVKIRDDLIQGDYPWGNQTLYCNEFMAQNAGKFVTIKAVDESFGVSSYLLQEVDCYWCDSMFDDTVSPVQRETLVKDFVTEITREGVITWLGKHYTDGAYTEAFGFECSIDQLVELKTPEEIIKCIEAYEEKHRMKEEDDPVRN